MESNKNALNPMESNEILSILQNPMKSIQNLIDSKEIYGNLLTSLDPGP